MAESEKTTLKKIKLTISQGKLDLAIEQLLNFFEEQSNDALYNEVITISTKNAQLNQEERNFGTTEEIRREKTKVAAQILSVIEAFNQKKRTPKYKTGLKYKMLYGSLFLFFAVASGYLIKTFSDGNYECEQKFNSAFKLIEMGDYIEGLKALNNLRETCNTNDDTNAKITNYEKELTSILKELKNEGENATPIVFNIGEDFSEIKKLNISELENPLNASKSICRIISKYPSGEERGYSTGFLVENNFVVGVDFMVENKNELQYVELEFGYNKGNNEKTFIYKIDTTKLIIRKENGYLLAKVEQKSNSFPLKNWGYLKMANTLPYLNEKINIISHPYGKEKRISIGNNRILIIDDNKISYTADTERGSAGAPIFNSNWEVIGIHRAGIKEHLSKIVDDNGKKIPYKEGMLIIKDLKLQLNSISARQSRIR